MEVLLFFRERCLSHMAPLPRGRIAKDADRKQIGRITAKSRKWRLGRRQKIMEIRETKTTRNVLIIKKLSPCSAGYSYIPCYAFLTHQ